MAERERLHNTMEKYTLIYKPLLLKRMVDIVGESMEKDN